MCGIAGFLTFDVARPGKAITQVAKAMSDMLAHRGPDSDGQWVDKATGLGLAHRRLSIIDLSPKGAQPMHSADGRYVLSYNGEIYNYRALREQLERRFSDIRWRGTSDTEVMLELIARDGVENALKQLDGMFALSLWDRKEKRLTLARDPFGEKPLYYGWSAGALVFASELKALFAFPGFAPEVDEAQVANFLKYAYVPAPFSIYRDVFKLEAGCFVSIDNQALLGRDVDVQPYWSAADAATEGLDNPFAGSREEALKQAETLLSASVDRRMVADVPLGCLLSGGIDSTMVTALMQKSSSAPVKTFCIGMAEQGFNEADHAREVANYLGTDHTELVVSPDDAIRLIPQMAGIFDEPFADSSQLPTLLVSQLARQSVTVAMSGDGGDEIFGGYNRYFHGPRVLDAVERYPLQLRRLVAVMAGKFSPELMQSMGRFLPSEFSSGRGYEKLQKLAGLFGSENKRDLHDRLLSAGSTQIAHPDLRNSACILPDRLTDRFADSGFFHQAVLLDVLNYLPDDILTKVDRTSMSVSLETRTPFLNTDLFEFMWRLPADMHTTKSQGKLLLRELLYSHVPQELVDRPKSGFAIPMGRWFRNELKDWVGDTVSDLVRHGSAYLDVRAVDNLWQSHLNGRANNDTVLWTVLVFQGWLKASAQATSAQVAAQ